MFGGNDGSHYLKSCERYDIRANKWEVIAELPMCVGAHTSTVWNDSIVTMGTVPYNVIVTAKIAARKYIPRTL